MPSTIDSLFESFGDLDLGSALKAREAIEHRIAVLSLQNLNPELIDRIDSDPALADADSLTDKLSFLR